MARGGLLLGLALAGCGPSFAGLVEGGYETALIVRIDGAEVELESRPAAQLEAGLRFDAPSTAAVFLLLYQASAAALGLTNPIAPGAARPLPPADRGYHFDGRVLAAPDAAALALLNTVRLPPFPLAECLDAGGCLAAGERLECTRACPAVSPAAPDPPASPRPPELPRFAPCERGWTVAAGPRPSIVPCEPPAPPAPLTCPVGQYRFLADAGCAPVGDACPSGSFPPAPPGNAPLYVAPGGSGSGTELDPMGSLAAALAAAGPGGTILLAAGRHEATELEVSGPVHVMGACAAATTLAAARVRVGGSGVLLANLSVAGDLELDGAQDARLSGIVIGRGAGTGLRVTGGDAVLARVVVEERAAAVVVRAARLWADDLAMVGTTSVALAASDGAALQLTRLEVAGTGRGVCLQGAAAATVTGALIRGANPGIEVVGSRLTGDGLVLRPERAGIAVQARRSQATLRWSAISRAALGLQALEGSDVTLEDSLLEELRESLDPLAIEVGSSTLTARRVQLRRSGGGIRAQGAVLHLEDLLIADLDASTGNARGGQGIAEQAGRLAVVRAWIQRTAGDAVRSETARDVQLTDLVLVDTAHAPDTSCPRCEASVRVTKAARLSLDRVEAVGVLAPVLFLDALRGGERFQDVSLAGVRVRGNGAGDRRTAIHAAAEWTGPPLISWTRLRVQGAAQALYLSRGQVELSDVRAEIEDAPAGTPALSFFEGGDFNLMRVELVGAEGLRARGGELEQMTVRASDLRVEQGTRGISVERQASLTVSRAVLRAEGGCVVCGVEGGGALALREVELGGAATAVEIRQPLSLAAFTLNDALLAFLDDFPEPLEPFDTGLVQRSNQLWAQGRSPRALYDLLRRVRVVP